MTSNLSTTSKAEAQKWILRGIPFLIVIGTLMHFIYGWSGNSVIVGIFAPVNESVWEHLKLAFWPAIFWWALGNYVLNKNSSPSPGLWVLTCAAAELTYILVILSFFYTYTGALGIESFILDIFSFFLAVVLGQFFALHLYKYAATDKVCVFLAVLALILMAAAFTVFTFNPPHLPIFMDPLEGTYGI